MKYKIGFSFLLNSIAIFLFLSFLSHIWDLLIRPKILIVLFFNLVIGILILLWSYFFDKAKNSIKLSHKYIYIFSGCFFITAVLLFSFFISLNVIPFEKNKKIENKEYAGFLISKDKMEFYKVKNIFFLDAKDKKVIEVK